MVRRWWFLSGVGFAVLLVVGFLLANGPLPENTNAPDADWTKVYSSSSDRATILVGAFVLVAAGLVFLWFAATLLAAFSKEADASAVLASVAAGSAVAFVVIEMVAALTMGAVAGSITFGDAPVPAADFGRQLSQLGAGLLLLPGSWSAAVFVASTTRLGSTVGALARWMAVCGYVAAILLLFGVVFLPFLALPLWAIIIGIALARRPLPLTAT